jgi:hypothetical protein
MWDNTKDMADGYGPKKKKKKKKIFGRECCLEIKKIESAAPLE